MDEEALVGECLICNELMEEVFSLIANDESGVCNHSFCKNCIEDYIQRKQNSNGRLVCPYCQRPMHAPYYTLNIVATDFAKHFKKERENERENDQVLLKQQLETQRERERALLQEREDREKQLLAQLQDRERQLSALGEERERQLSALGDERERLRRLEIELNKQREDRVRLERIYEEAERQRAITERRQNELEMQNEVEQRNRESETKRLRKELRKREKETQDSKNRIEELNIKIQSLNGEEEKARQYEEQLREEKRKSELNDRQREELIRQMDDISLEAKRAKDQLDLLIKEAQEREEANRQRYNTDLLESKKLEEALRQRLKEQEDRLKEIKSREKIVKLPKPKKPFQISSTPPSYTNSLWTTLYGYVYGEIWRGPLIRSIDTINILESRGSRVPSPVSRVADKNKNAQYALKRIPLAPYVPRPASNPKGAQEENLSDSETETAELNRSYKFYTGFREALFLTNLNHDNIIKLLSMVRKEKESYHIVMPYIPYDLNYLSIGSSYYTLTLEDVQYIFYRILGAVNYLHSADIVHRDLKTSSVLVTCEVSSKGISNITKVKLASFGQARSLLMPWPKICQSTQMDKTPSTWASTLGASLLVSSAVTTEYNFRDPNTIATNQPEFDKLPERKYNICYWAPELALLEEVDYVIPQFNWKKCDIWSLGCTLAEMLRAGEPLFNAKKTYALLMQILKIKECRPSEFEDSYLKSPQFPVKSNWWPEEASQTLNVAVTYLPPAIRHYRTPTLKNTKSDTLASRCVDLLSKMLEFDPDLRPSCEELLKHEFFSDLGRHASVESLCQQSDAETLTDQYLVEYVYRDCGGP